MNSVDFSHIFHGMFSIFAFYRELSRFTVFYLDVIQLFLFTFLTIFLTILTQFSSILLKYDKIVNCSVIDFICKDRGGSLNCSI